MMVNHDDYRETKTHQNARRFGSSMAERQRFGCLDNWPYNCKQIPSLRFPILYIGQGLFKEIGMNHNAQVQIFKKFGEICSKSLI